MAEVQDSSTSSGIKLFGATIDLQDKQALAKEDNTRQGYQTCDKKPDKIIPCPRCKSMDTKFCYFNNYNINQPRHFCKGCHRYWTAGGALRNVPVGAGRRKAKQQVSEGSLFDVSSMQQLEFDSVADGWQLAEHGDCQPIFPAKRRRNYSSSNEDR